MDDSMTDEPLRARRRFVSWLRWYMDWHPEVPSDAALARSLGVTSSAVHYLLTKGSTRMPSFETLLAARRLLGVPLEKMLYQDPPSARPPRE